MTDLRKAAEAVLEAWDWDWSEPRNEALKERMEALRKAAEMALERLESHEYWMDEEAIKALRQALAQPEQRGHCTCGDPEALGVVHFRTRPCFHYTEPLAQPEQEPVAWGMRRKDGVILDIKNADFEHEGYEKIYTVPLYTAPPKREWVGLTDEEIHEMIMGMRSRNMGVIMTEEIFRDVEAKLKEKNT